MGNFSSKLLSYAEELILKSFNVTPNDYFAMYLLFTIN